MIDFPFLTEGHPKTPWCLAFHPLNNDLLASGCYTGDVRVWDLQSDACEHWQCSKEMILSVCFHPTQHLLTIATQNCLHFWDWRKGAEGFVMSLSTGQLRQKVLYARFDSSGRRLITGISNMKSNFKPLIGMGLLDGVTLPDGTFTSSIQHLHQSAEQRQRTTPHTAATTANNGAANIAPITRTTRGHVLTVTQNLAQSNAIGGTTISNAISTLQSNNQSGHHNRLSSSTSISRSSLPTTWADDELFPSDSNSSSLSSTDSIFSQSQTNLLQAEAISSLSHTLRSEAYAAFTEPSVHDSAATTPSSSSSSFFASLSTAASSAEPALMPPSGYSLASARGSSLFNRLLAIYRRLEGMDETRSTTTTNTLNTAADPTRPLQSGGNEFSVISETSHIVERLIERYRDSPTHPDPAPPSTELDLNLSNDSNRSAATTLHGFDYSRTFSRLSVLCHQLPQLIRNFYEPLTAGLVTPNDSSVVSNPQLQPMDNLPPSSILFHLQSRSLNSNSFSISSTESRRTNYIVSLLNRIQESLQMMNQNQNDPFFAGADMQQLHRRVSEVIERLANVTGYRERLSSLRNQIFELFEHIHSEQQLQTQRHDLFHCLCLVNMSINLTRQMQRILAADLRLTQLTQLSLVNNLLSTNDVPVASPSNTTSTSADRLRTKRTIDSASNDSKAKRPVTSNSNQKIDDRRSTTVEPIASTSTTTANAPETLRHSAQYMSSISQIQTEIWTLLSEQNLLDWCFNRNNRALSPANAARSNESIRRNATNPSNPTSTSPSRLRATPSRRDSRRYVPSFAAAASHHLPNASGTWMLGTNESFSFISATDHQPSYRLQCWDLGSPELPDFEDIETRLIVSKCLIQNASSVDLSPDGQLIACFVPVESGNGVNFCIFSLRHSSFGQCIYSFNFTSNAISVSFSPTGRFLLVGLGSTRMLSSYLTPPQDESSTIAHLFELCPPRTASKSTIQDGTNEKLSLNQPEVEESRMDNTNIDEQLYQYSNFRQGAIRKVRSIQVPRAGDQFGINSIRWLPFAGEGFIYGTHQGQMVICRPKFNQPTHRPSTNTIQINVPRLESSTATNQSIGTQTQSNSSTEVGSNHTLL